MNFSSLPLCSSTSPAFLFAGLLLVGCSSTGTTKTGRAEVHEAIRGGKFEHGVVLAKGLIEESGGTEDTLELHRIATIAFYLDQGRRETFEDNDEEALAWLLRAEQIAPESERVLEWLGKTRLKLTKKWHAIGQEAFALESYSEASEAYHKALEYIPGYPLAIVGLGQVTIQTNYRNGLGEEYYIEGVKALANYRLRSAKRGFSATTKYLPQMDRARSRATEVDTLLAEQRVEIAWGFEEEGLYAGALSEFRFALALDDTNQDALDGVERLAIEAEAAQILRDAQMDIFRHDFDDALTLLAKGEEMTRVQKDKFIEARDLVHEERLDIIYQRALNFEYDGEYESAVETYAELLTKVVHFQDALARKSTLEGYIEMAALYYEKAEAEQDSEIKLQHLRSIGGFWPDYKDVRQLISQLE